MNVSKVPSEIKILPLGHVHSQKGDFFVDNESFELMLKRFKERKLDIVIDYEHQTLNDIQAPAGGWIKELYKTADAIMAKVEWTERAKEYLKNKEYRYLSPVVCCRKRDRKAVELHSVALTNTPAIDGMFSIVNSVMSDADDPDPDGAGQPDEENMPDMNEKSILNTLAALLGLPEGSDLKVIESTIKSLQKSKNSAEKEVESLKYEAFENEVDEAVTYALKTGKISAAMREDATSLARRDLEFFKSYVEKSHSVVPMGKYDTMPNRYSNLKSDCSQVNNMLGITDEDVKKYNR